MPNRPSRDRRAMSPGKTHNARKTAPAAIERRSSRVARAGRPAARTPCFRLPRLPRLARARESLCIFVSLFAVSLASRNDFPRTRASRSWRRRRRPVTPARRRQRPSSAIRYGCKGGRHPARMPCFRPAPHRARPRGVVRKHCAYVYLYAQICITTRSAFFVPNRPSRERRESFLGASGEDRQCRESGASGHRARRGHGGKGGAPGGPNAPLPIPPTPPPRARESMCIFVSLFRSESCLPKTLSKGHARDS